MAEFPKQPESTAPEPSGRAPQRPAERPRGAQADGDLALPPSNREEVVGRGSGGTAGGPPGKGVEPAKRLVSCNPSDDDPAASFDPAEIERGGDPSNTPPRKTMTGGEDWLSLSLYLNFEEEVFRDLAEKLDAAQRAASEDRQPYDEVDFGESKFIVKPRGVKQGSAGKGSWMRWRMEGMGGLKILLMNRAEVHQSMPNGMAVIPSRLLMSVGTTRALEIVDDVIFSMGGDLRERKVSRVDACVDLPGVHVSEFVDPYRKGWLVTRASSRAEYDVGLRQGAYYVGTRPTGFMVGKSPLSLRVYDKLQEVSKDAEKLALLRDRRWGGQPEAATRVEYEIGRERLKSFGVDTVEDWLEKRGSICQVLTREWFRLTAGEVDRKHADRTPILPLWEFVGQQFADWTDFQGYVDLTPLQQLDVDNSRLANSALGFLIGYMARSGKVILDNGMFERECLAALRDSIGFRDMAEAVRRRALEGGQG